MKSIKEQFFNTVHNITKSKILNYYFYKDLPSKQNYPHILSREIYTKKINKQIYFFHLLETIWRTVKVDTKRFALNNHIYYFGYRFSSYSTKILIAQNLPDIPYLNKNWLINSMITFSRDRMPQYKMQYCISRRVFVPDGSLFHRVNFLNEKINNWILCSIFLWRSITNKCNSKPTHQIKHVYGIYKRGRSSLGVELLFNRGQISRESGRVKDKNRLSLLRNNKKYSIIVRMGNTEKKGRLDYKKEMRTILTEIIQNLKYYSISD